jgi:hypothetical protein
VNARLSSPDEQKGQHWRLSDFDAAEIDERPALQQSVVLLDASPAKLKWLINSQNKDFARFDGNRRKSIRGRVDRSHAVDPCVHVAPVEVWKSELALEGLVKAGPVDSLLNGDGDHSHHVQ